MQTNLSPVIVKQREQELQDTICANQRSPGVMELREYAALKAAAAHANYLKGGPTPELHAVECAWHEVMRVIDHGPKVKLNEQRVGERTNG